MKAAFVIDTVMIVVIIINTEILNDVSLTTEMTIWFLSQGF